MRLERLRRPDDALVYDLVPYEDQMDRFYGGASLAVCRAGAVTVAELAAAGVPSVLVPWPGAAGDHQTDNARVMEAAGAAVLVPDAQADGARIEAVTRELLARPGAAVVDVRRGAVARPGPTRPTGSRTWWRRQPVPAPEPGRVLDLREPRRIHVVGVGGAGMSAYAAILAELGHRVSGSDLHEHPRLERLRLLGVECLVPQTADNVPADADAVVFSSAVPRTNVEVVAAERAGIPVLSRADALAGIVATRRALGVAGTHGKTTTTSMITLILRAADLHPSFLVGSELNEVGSNAGLDAGEWLVVEADESDGTFLRLGLDAAIVTNVDADHLWYWGDMARLEDAFRRFVDGVEGPVVLCADDADARARSPPTARTRSPTAGPTTPATAPRTTGAGASGSSFVLERDGELLGEIRLPVTGRHNAQNATGAAAMTMELGVEFDAVQRALAELRRRRPPLPAPGRARRRHDHRRLRAAPARDPGHDPRRVARAAGGRIIAVFQPFRYARTAIMWQEFADAFVGADQVILTDVCGFHEQPIPGVTGHLLLNAVLDAHPELPVAYFPHRAELLKLVADLRAAGRPGPDPRRRRHHDPRRRAARRRAAAGAGE